MMARRQFRVDRPYLFSTRACTTPYVDPLSNCWIQLLIFESVEVGPSKSF